MTIPVKETGKDIEYKLMPAGIHAAVCDMVVNIGNQRGEYQGQEIIKEKVYLRFEVPAERLEYTSKEGENVNRPMSIGSTFTNSLHEKSSLRPFLESWRGRAFTEGELKLFDLATIAGKPCMLTVEHKLKNDKTYANITGIARFSKTIKVGGKEVSIEEPKAEMPIVLFHPDEENESFNDLPNWLQKLILNRLIKADEQQAEATPVKPDFTDDDIPF